jgi:hypothetical protein
MNRAAAKPPYGLTRRRERRNFISSAMSRPPDAPGTPGPRHHAASLRHLDITIVRHHDAFMRTTLTLDPDVAERVAGEVRRTGRSLKAVVNDAIRLGLGLGGKTPRGRRFTVQPHPFGLRPGIDPDRLNQLVDELDVEQATRKISR